MGTAADALFGSTRKAVLRLLFTHSERRFYQREMIRQLAIGSGSVQREVAQLVNAGVLTRTADGHQIYVQANPRCPIYEELRSIVRKTFGITEVLLEALGPVRSKIQFAFVFGSIAAGRETAESDIDLMIIGDGATLREVVGALSPAQTQLSREINPTVFGVEEFCRRLAEGQHFIRAVAAGEKLFVHGSQPEFDRLAKEQLVAGSHSKRAGDRRSVRSRR